MKRTCWNCGRPLADGAEYCQACEAKADENPLYEIAPELRALEDETLSPEERARLQKKMEDLQREAAEVIAKLIPHARAELEQLADGGLTAEEAADAILAGHCPACSSSSVRCCDSVVGIESPVVAMCLDCHALFCIGCGRVFEDASEIKSPSSECPQCGAVSDSSEEEDRELAEFLIGDPFIEVCEQCGLVYCAFCGQALDIDDEWAGEDAADDE